MRIVASLFFMFAPAILIAQQAINVQAGSPTYIAIMASARKSFGKPKPFTTGPSIDAVRVAGQWAFVFDRLEGGEAKDGAVEWACLLIKTHGKWHVRLAQIGSNARKNVMSGKYRVPKELFNVPGPKIS